MESYSTSLAGGRDPDEVVLPEIGWAIVEGGVIDVRTVSQTQRAAKINWLVVSCNQTILAIMSDEDIEEFWKLNAPGRAARCVEVNIELHEP